jgi:hypothetical protein
MFSAYGSYSGGKKNHIDAKNKATKIGRLIAFGSRTIRGMITTNTNRNTKAQQNISTRLPKECLR